MTRKWPRIVCPHCATGYSRMEYVTMQRKSRQDEFPCAACGGEISTHDPRIRPQKGAVYKRVAEARAK